MKSVKNFIAVIFAMVGVGGAYATTAVNNSRVGEIYVCYDRNGTPIVIGTLGAARAVGGCDGGVNECLRCTTSGHPEVILLKP